MVALSVQALLLMAVAYFLGAALACMIRRSFVPAVRTPAAAGERRVDPLPEVALRDAQAAAAIAAAARTAAPAPPVAPAAATLVVPAKPAPVAAPAPVAPPVSTPQDLKSIQGIDPATETRLNGLGISRFEQIAAWTRADIDRIGQVFGKKGRAARENWIEQAQILARGGQTLFSLRRARGEGSTAAPTPDEGVAGAPPAPTLPLPMSRVGVAAVVIAPPPASLAPPVLPPSVSDRAAFAHASSALAPDAAVPIRPPESPAHDNLQRIGGITAEIEQRLNALGVARYSQIAQWSPVDVERIDAELKLGGRISRGNWIEQAHILGRGGDTAFSREFDRHGSAPPAGPPPLPIKLPDAIRAHEAAKAAGKTDLGALRSVRSEAYQDTAEPGPEAARRVAARKVARTGPPDDLKRIRGVGVLIERKLNALGVSRYEDIANWTADDIDRVSEQLDFKGRIQREGWVEQARILAAGGDTEFSRRLDRRDGDGRPKS